MSEEPKIYKATATAWKDFRDESFLWHDMKLHLQEWHADVLQGYPEATSMLEKGRVDGRLEALSYFLALPDVLIEAFADAQRQKELKCENITDEEND